MMDIQENIDEIDNDAIRSNEVESESVENSRVRSLQESAKEQALEEAKTILKEQTSMEMMIAHELRRYVREMLDSGEIMTLVAPDLNSSPIVDNKEVENDSESANDE